MKLLDKLMRWLKREKTYIYHCEDGLAVINEKTCVVNRQITIGNKIYAISKINEVILVGEQEEYKEGE